jgi:hypothetical protein
MEKAEKQLKFLKESFLMYERTKKETYEKLREALNEDGSRKYSDSDIEMKIEQINTMQNDIIEKYKIIGGNIDDLKAIEVKKEEKPKKERRIVSKKENTKKVLNEKVKKPISKNQKIDKIENLNEDVNETIKETNNNQTPFINNWDEINFRDSFDVIPLPSKGKCYDNGMSTIAVSYLTANDENMIVSPNLYRDGLIIDYLLKSKINNKNIDPDDLLEGDREAIILWLRATGYGLQYPITVTDNKTGVDFDTVIDLTQIKHKPFVLEGDGFGNFDYQLPVSKDNVKFRFLTHGDIKQIEEIEREEKVNIKKERLKGIVEELESYLENDDTLTKDEKIKLYEAKRNINKWSENLLVDNDMGYTHKLTNKLELSIVSINNNDDREYISDYINKMNVRDAYSLRKYISENEPGLDYTVMVERPESLGGGSMAVFLSLDEYVFLNIT